MNNDKIRKILNDAAEKRAICNIYMKYDAYYRNCFPLAVSDKLFLAAEEDDFILDGFSVFRIKDTEKAKCKDDKCLEIAVAEGLLNQLTIPAVDISGWKSVFESLEKIGKNIIIEKESPDDDEYELAIGKIIEVCKNKVSLLRFDADGVWDDEPVEIKLSGITAVSFGTRYVDVFSKYLPTCEYVNKKQTENN